MLKELAKEQLINFCLYNLNLAISLTDAEKLLDYLTTEDGENGLGLMPPLSKKGRYEWEQPSIKLENYQSLSQDSNSSEGN